MPNISHSYGIAVFLLSSPAKRVKATKMRSSPTKRVKATKIKTCESTVLTKKRTSVGWFGGDYHQRWQDEVQHSKLGEGRLYMLQTQVGAASMEWLDDG